MNYCHIFLKGPLCLLDSVHEHFGSLSLSSVLCTAAKATSQLLSFLTGLANSQQSHLAPAPRMTFPPGPFISGFLEEFLDYASRDLSNPPLPLADTRTPFLDNLPPGPLVFLMSGTFKVRLKLTSSFPPSSSPL